MVAKLLSTCRTRRNEPSKDEDADHEPEKDTCKAELTVPSNCSKYIVATDWHPLSFVSHNI